MKLVRMPIIENKVVGRKVITKNELRKKVKTNKILIDVNAFSEIMKYFISKGREEAACLLRGKIAGEYLVIWDIHKCEDSKGTAATVRINPVEFTKANKDDGYYVVGWAHSHPGYTVFMSGTDRDTQLSMQGLFPDAVAMVMDPFHKDGVQFGFFRAEGRRVKEIDFAYLVERWKHQGTL